MKRRTFLGSAFAATAAVALPTRRGLEALFIEAPSSPADLDAVTGDGREIRIPGTDVTELMQRLRGRVLLAGDDGYNEARRILNPDFDKRPALVIQPTGAADVEIAVDFARQFSLLTAVKCGGHSHSGKSTCDKGLQIDLSSYRGVRVDPVARRAWVDGGTLLGLVDHEAMAHGLVTPLGTVSHTGVGGLTLGGGFGRLARRYGLAVDNLIAIDVVTADGVPRRASEQINPELFWGLRGGGGNFGIATTFEFELHPMEREVIGGEIVFPYDRAKDLLAAYGEYGAEAPDSLQLDYFQAFGIAGAPPVAGIAICYSGPPARADEVLAPIRKVGTPLADTMRTVDYVALQRSGDIDDPRAQGSYMKGGFVPAIPSGLIDAIVDGMEGHPDRNTLLFFQQSGGAINRVPSDGTAFSNRSTFGNMITSVGWPFGSERDEHVAWCRQYWTALEPFTEGFYTNDADTELSETQMDSNWGENLERLVRLKDRYDPTNLFRLNTNIEPSA